MRLRQLPATTGMMLLLAVSTGWASVGIPIPVERLAARAELVVEGTVSAVASGVDPERGSVATYVTVTVQRTLRGPAGMRELVLRQPGGRWGDRVLVVDHAAHFVAGEQVYLFLEPATDGALRPVGSFYGKFSLSTAERSTPQAGRELEPHGPALARGLAPRVERLPVADLDALALTVRREGAARSWLPRPAEWRRLEWQPESRIPATARFAPDAGGAPSRWEESDMDMPIPVRLWGGADPLGDPAAARRAVESALDAWSMIPEARVVLQVDDTPRPSGGNGPSPTGSYTGENTVAFGDPWDDMPDPVDCTGLLAIGGYWRSETPGRTVNGVTFYPVLQMYVIVNDGFECFFSNEDNLAEVLAHEVGHGLGFGHSSAPDALMRAVAYGGRGARLGLDDLDAVHCHYPHQFLLTSPLGGENWGAGSMRAVRWESSDEVSTDPGTVAVEFSVDDGATWTMVSELERNDGQFRWRVPSLVTGPILLRVVRHAQGGWLPENYPEACSQAATKAPLTVVSGPPEEPPTGRPLAPKGVSVR